MKKTLVIVMVAVLGLSMAARALEPVEFSSDCSYTFDAGWQFDLWIVILAQAKANELRVALYTNPTADWDDVIVKPSETIDMELVRVVEGVPTVDPLHPGDGVPDLAQIYLLTSAMCADEDLVAAYEANLALLMGNGLAPEDEGYVAGLIPEIQAIIDWADSADAQKTYPLALGFNDLHTDLNQLVTDLTTLATTLGAAGPPYNGYVGTVTAAAAGLVGLDDALGDVRDGLGAFASSLLPLMQTAGDDAALAPIVGPLTTVASVVALDGGLSSEMSATLGALLGSLLEELTAPIDSLGGATPAQLMTLMGGQLAANKALVAGGLGTLATQLGGLVTGLAAVGAIPIGATCLSEAGALATDATALQTLWNADVDALAAALVAGAPLLGIPAAPEFAVYGTVPGKFLGEPFSGLGDYDGDGTNNAAVWTQVVAGGGTAEDFVGAASDFTDFYPGNPNLPAAGLIGLAALVSAIAGGGALVLRKK